MHAAIRTPRSACGTRHQPTGDREMGGAFMTPDTSIAVSTQTAIARVRPTAIADLSPIVAEANSIAISNADSYQSADLFLFRVRQAIKKGESLIDPIKKPINEAKAAVMKLEHDLLDPLKIAEATVKQRMAQWQIEDRRRGEEEGRRAAICDRSEEHTPEL